MIESENHFSDEAWADFVRGVMSPETSRPMQQHLDDNCDQCRSRQSFWNLVARAAIKELGYQPPGFAIRLVEDAFKSMQPPPAPTGPPERARLIPAASIERVLANVRGPGNTPHHLLYETNDFLVDLRVRVRGDGSGVVVGEIVPKTGMVAAAAGTRVDLKQTNRVVQQTEADEFGGFQLEWDSSDDSKILLEIPDGRIIEIVLPIE
jgi:hypothetical protein